MKRKDFFLSIIFLLSIFQFSCKENKPALRLATYTYSTNNRIDNLKPLGQKLETVLNRKVSIKSYPDVESFITGIQSDEVDVGLINTLGYLILALDNQTMQPIANLKIRNDATDNYKSVVLANKEKVADINMLKSNVDSLTIAFTNKGSTSGNLLPRLFLSSIGINTPETQFKEVKYGGNHTSTIEQFLAGDADLCSIGSNEYFKQLKANPAILEKNEVLWISEEIPLGPVLLHHEIEQKEKEEITNLFLNLHQSDPEVLNSIKDGWSEAKQADNFQGISDTYYDNFRKMNGNETNLSDILNLFAK